MAIALISRSATSTTTKYHLEAVEVALCYFGVAFLNYLFQFLDSLLTALTCSLNMVKVESAPTVSVSFS